MGDDVHAAESRPPRGWTSPGSAAAAAAAAATAAAGRRAAAVARLLAAAATAPGEDGELLAHVRRGAIRAVGRVAVADELLEVRLALHAHVFVDRHCFGAYQPSGAR